MGGVNGLKCITMHSCLSTWSAWRARPHPADLLGRASSMRLLPSGEEIQRFIAALKYSDLHRISLWRASFLVAESSKGPLDLFWPTQSLRSISATIDRLTSDSSVLLNRSDKSIPDIDPRYRDFGFTLT